MTLEHAIDSYVQRKQAMGMSYGKAYQIYLAFLRTAGNLSLNQINANHVFEFLNQFKTSDAFRKRHSLLRHFFDYWARHGEMAGLSMPTNRPAKRSTFLPYIYTREELRRLLRLAPSRKTANDTFHHRTLRAALLTLYATGASVGEVLTLANEDVDLRNGFIKFAGSPLKAARCIPIGKDLVKVLRQYVGWRTRIGARSESFFSRIDGREISPRRLLAHFERLCKSARINCYRETSRTPCVRDLRATFAVHQITAWIRRKEDLNVMLPALGSYMGNVGLESTERYLQLTPQRFQTSLNKLSPQKSRTRWQRDPALLEFLATL